MSETVPALVELKLDILRTVRALDAAGVNPGAHSGAPEALADCAELDMLLTKLLELLDREPPAADAPVPEEVRDACRMGPEVVARVFRMLPKRERRAARRQLGQVGAAAPEVWLEVSGLRESMGDTPDQDPTTEEAGQQQQHEDAAHLFALGGPEEGPDARVVEIESRELPDSSELEEWLLTLPLSWLRTIARMHRVDPDRRRTVLASDLSAQLLDIDALALVLESGLGHRERLRLAEFLPDEIPLKALPADIRGGLDVPWDWSHCLPAGLGGRLRAFGLAYVGLRDGTRVVAVPPQLRGPLAEALWEADPDGMNQLPPEALERLDDLLDDSDDWLPEEDENKNENDGFLRELTTLLDPDPERRAWRERAARVTGLVAAELEAREIPEGDLAACLALLAEVREPNDDDLWYLLPIVAFELRLEPEAPTTAEEVLATAELSADERSILLSQIQSRPGLYRVVSSDTGRGMRIEDAFLTGSPTWLDMPEMAFGIEPGGVFPARLFHAGPLQLIHPVGTPIPPELAEDAVAKLEEMFKEFAKSTGCLDREAFLRDRPFSPSLSTLLLPDYEEDEEEYEAPAPRTNRKAKPKKSYVLDVELLDSNPPIQRRICVSGRRTLGELHEILQAVMGWSDEHLHMFVARDRSWRYASRAQGVDGAGDERQVTIDEIAPRKGSRFFYEYDFGDSWVHEIRVAERLAPSKAGPEPRCLGGANACPPEDSGGVWGYMSKLEALGDRSHPDHERMTEWMGEDFDPTHFDLEAVNRYFGLAPPS